jgi:hypothetical protein
MLLGLESSINGFEELLDLIMQFELKNTMLKEKNRLQYGDGFFSVFNRVFTC